MPALPQIFTSYSFEDVQVAITGPGGAFSIGSDAGTAEGGISLDMTEDKDTMVIGADGSAMHSLHAGTGGTLTLRLLKVSTVNFLLSTMYNFQALSSANWGQNVIVLNNIATGDNLTCMGCAFRRQPNNLWAKDGNVIEWGFNVGYVYELLGAGG